MADNMTEVLLDMIEREAKHKTRQEESAIYYVLSALRGPDNLSPIAFDMKQKTTARLRYVIGMRNYMIDINPDPVSPIPSHDEIVDACGGHFADHYTMACHVVAKLYDYDLLRDG